MAYPVKLCRAKVQMLRMLEEAGGEANVRDLPIPRVHYPFFATMRHFGFIRCVYRTSRRKDQVWVPVPYLQEEAAEARGWSRVNGRWWLTPLGRLFLANKIAVRDHMMRITHTELFVWHPNAKKLRANEIVIDEQHPDPATVIWDHGDA